ncbi:MAG: hypothetical protein IJL02_09845 [Methanobrevibacter sp.]|uniref:hypothetical protein n=1 Tax=Methanobrevibacter sp. TaxID=66852 RepID=UPI0025D345F8|nr:hypothetical protein [Methanobrevibacter sp.]MBQ6100143.1 hypothetical protein [Methanobrevibacter sp.]
MSELKELIEKFIELDDSLNEQVEQLEESEEAYAKFEQEHIDEINDLNETYHEIEHMVFHEQFIIVSNNSSDEKEVVALIISDENDEEEEFVIPVFTDEKEANIAIEEFKQQFGDIEFICDKRSGNEIVADHHDDEDFIGLAINAPQWDFVIATEDVHDCSE